jgi:hypothetical protein
MLNDLRKNPTTFSEVRESVIIQSKNIDKLIEVEEYHSTNVIKHHQIL